MTVTPLQIMHNPTPGSGVELDVEAGLGVAAAEAALNAFDQQLIDLVRQRRVAAGLLRQARIAAGQPGYVHAEGVALARRCVEVLGPRLGAELATLLLRLR